MAKDFIKMLLSLKKDKKCSVGILADYCWFIKGILLNCCMMKRMIAEPFFCCFSVSTSIHFCIFDNVNLPLFCQYFYQAICDCIIEYVVTLCKDVAYSDPRT